MCMIDDADGSPAFSLEQRHKARKPHRCGECFRTIAPGETYVYASWLMDGDFDVDRQCAHCAAAATLLELHCRGFVYGGVAEDLESHFRQFVGWNYQAGALSGLYPPQMAAVQRRWTYACAKRGRRPMIRRALYRLTAGLRCRLISRDGRPYLERYYLGRLGPVTAYLHRFVGRDGDEETHDHPWRAISLVLAGSYREERARLNGAAPPLIRLRRVRWANALAQLAGRAREAAERIEHDAAEIARMRSALDWYAEMAKTMQRATLRVDNQVALHILKQMALDGGKRAREALTSNERPVRPCNRS